MRWWSIRAISPDRRRHPVARPILDVRTYADMTADAGMFLFSRDCLEVEVVPGAMTPFINHLGKYRNHGGLAAGMSCGGASRARGRHRALAVSRLGSTTASCRRATNDEPSAQTLAWCRIGHQCTGLIAA
jgi:hypothetical protein